jgi:hypothetical protein
MLLPVKTWNLPSELSNFTIRPALYNRGVINLYVYNGK